MFQKSLAWHSLIGYIDTGIAGIAQLVERNLAKVDVAGSNPVSRSILLRFIFQQSAERP